MGTGVPELSAEYGTAMRQRPVCNRNGERVPHDQEVEL